MAAVMLRLALIPMLLFASATAAQAQGGNAAAGRRFVADSCSDCHAERQLSLSHNGAPTFAAVAADPTVTALSLRAFFQTPHASMPNIILTREQIEDVISYILKLRAK